MENNKKIGFKCIINELKTIRSIFNYYAKAMILKSSELNLSLRFFFNSIYLEASIKIQIISLWQENWIC